MLGKSVSGSLTRHTSSSWSGRRARAKSLVLRQVSLSLQETTRAAAPKATPQKKGRREKGLERAQPAHHRMVNRASAETKAPEKMVQTLLGLDKGKRRNKGSKGSATVEHNLKTKTGSQRFPPRGRCGRITRTSKGNRPAQGAHPSMSASSPSWVKLCGRAWTTCTCAWW